MLDRQKVSVFDVKKCIICQEDGSFNSTANGRRKIMEAAKIRNDYVYERLTSNALSEDFNYHMNNNCYKVQY